MQASYNKDSKKILEQIRQERATRENLNFLIKVEDTKPTEEEPQTLNKVWNYHDHKLQRKW